MSIKESIDQIKENLKNLESTKVRVALFGQPGAGKSSIINMLLGENKAIVSQRTDTTVERSVYKWNGILLEDLPGYGTSRFKKESYFSDFNIKENDLFLCVFSGKFHQADTEFFRELKTMNKVCIFIRNKHDEIWEDDKDIRILEEEIIKDVKKQVNDSNINIFFTSCRKKTGFDKLQESIFENLEPSKQERWARSSKAYSTKFLDQKRESCEKLITVSAGASAINAINPIPGLDIACDISVLLGLFMSIRNSYGLTTEKLESLGHHYGKSVLIQQAQPLITNIIISSTQAGILNFLKNFAGRQLTKQVTKYIPLIGQGVAASVGYAITKNAGSSYLDDCHKLAEIILKEELERR